MEQNIQGEERTNEKLDRGRETENAVQKQKNNERLLYRAGYVGRKQRGAV
ncbi:MAG: hypothetical protein PHE47_08740 [Oscillospiraceae bacterium]|nr:hypothetical protein [Oscillospiraceae bacterium]